MPALSNLANDLRLSTSDRHLGRQAMAGAMASETPVLLPRMVVAG